MKALCTPVFTSSVVLFLALTALPVFAADVLLETPITYQDSAAVNAQIRQECKPEELVQKFLGPLLAKKNASRNGTIANGEAAAGNSVLRLQITNVLGTSGGAWSGPKTIKVDAQLIDNGKVTRQTEINRWSIGGMFGGFRSTCSILSRSAEAVAKDLWRWSYDPTFIINKEAPPKEAAQPEVPSPTTAPVPPPSNTQ